MAFGPLLQEYDSVSVLTLPADNGTWGVGVITSARDKAMRSLKNLDVWTNVMKSMPLCAHWLDGEPLDDHVAVMAKIEDRHRSFVVDDLPVSTGVVALGGLLGVYESVGRARDFHRHNPCRRLA